MSAAPDARIVLRARGLLEACDLALQFIARHAKLYTRLTLLVAGVGLAISLVLRYVFDADWLTTWTVSLALATFFEGPFTVLTGHLAIRGDVTLREVGRAFGRRSFVFFLVMVLAAAFQSVAAVMMVVPWFFAALVTVFLHEVVLLEGAGFGSFRRAFRVVHGHNGRALGLVFLSLVLRASAVVLVDGALKRTLGVLLDVKIPTESLWRDGGSPYALAGLWLSVPVCAAFRYVAYVDLRTRKEGWDLQRRFHVLAARLAAAGTH